MNRFVPEKNVVRLTEYNTAIRVISSLHVLKFESEFFAEQKAGALFKGALDFPIFRDDSIRQQVRAIAGCQLHEILVATLSARCFFTDIPYHEVGEVTHNPLDLRGLATADLQAGH